MTVQAIAEQLQGPDMVPDYDQILAKRPHSSDAVFAWHQVRMCVLSHTACMGEAADMWAYARCSLLDTLQLSCQHTCRRHSTVKSHTTPSRAQIISASMVEFGVQSRADLNVMPRGCRSCASCSGLGCTQQACLQTAFSSSETCPHACMLECYNPRLSLRFTSP